MAGIWCNKNDLYSFIIETVGYKAGIIINSIEIDRFLPEEFKSISKLKGNNQMRLRSEAVEYLVAFILKKVGNITSASTCPSHIALFHQAKRDGYLESYERAMALFLKFNESEPKDQPINANKFLDITKRNESDMVYLFAVCIVTGFAKDLHRSPWASYRSIDWRDVKELNDLFQSESLETMHGTFFDERFISYLYENFDDISKINWRQFEGLTAEYFDKQGFQVKIGPGRKDGGIDIKIWPKEEDLTKPPLIIIQCKREKNKISAVVVKALYADILSSGASSGLIVTTSSLSRDAKHVCAVRNYPIDRAERSTLKQWIEEMRRTNKWLS